MPLIMCQNEKEGMVLNPHGEAMPAGNIAEEHHFLCLTPIAGTLDE